MTNQIPQNAIQVFNNRDVSNWTQRDGQDANWIVENGVMSVNKGDIMTQDRFTDFIMHILYIQNIPVRPPGG
ncbi:hypothetical protein MK131_05730 [Candidatus Poribacteria bacterium]|nr:hypothetical protein [Candidatus Poribacteria bacterium]